MSLNPFIFFFSPIFQLLTSIARSVEYQYTYSTLPVLRTDLGVPRVPTTDLYLHYYIRTAVESIQASVRRGRSSSTVHLMVPSTPGMSLSH